MLECASPAQLRKALEAANILVKMGINFVPMPVTSEAEHAELLARAFEKLEIMARNEEGSESNG